MSQTSRGPTNNTYTFALAFVDEATHFVGVASIEIQAKSPEDAALTLSALRQNREWLRTVPVLDIRHDEDLDGIVAGDFLLIQETIAPPGSPQRDGALEVDASSPPDSNMHTHARESHDDGAR